MVWQNIARTNTVSALNERINISLTRETETTSSRSSWPSGLDIFCSKRPPPLPPPSLIRIWREGGNCIVWHWANHFFKYVTKIFCEFWHDLNCINFDKVLYENMINYVFYVIMVTSIHTNYEWSCFFRFLKESWTTLNYAFVHIVRNAYCNHNWFFHFLNIWLVLSLGWCLMMLSLVYV